MDLDKLRKTAAEVVSRDDVKYLIGWRPGSYGYRVAPCFVEDAAGAGALTFSPLCSINLVTYLTLEEKLPLPRGSAPDERKVAVMVKGCDSRAVVQLLVEKGIRREQLVVIGCPCPGVVDTARLAEKYPEPLDPAEMKWSGRDLLLASDGRETTILPDGILAEKCRLCRYPNPILCDIVLGDPVETRAPEEDGAVNKVEALDQPARAAYWEERFAGCLRCYACRNSCPLCYCRDCILDRLNPTWVNRAVNFSENTAFHIARAFHLAGRCIECGECERVCPANIPLGQLNRKLATEVRIKYGFEPGIDPEGKPFQASFKPDDPDEFIL